MAVLVGIYYKNYKLFQNFIFIVLFKFRTKRDLLLILSNKVKKTKRLSPRGWQRKQQKMNLRKKFNRKINYKIPMYQKKRFYPKFYFQILKLSKFWIYNLRFFRLYPGHPLTFNFKKNIKNYY